MMLRLVLVFPLLAWIAFSARFNCRKEPPWPIDMQNNTQDLERLQRWLYAQQFDQKACANANHATLGYTHGLGSSVLESVRIMLTGLEHGISYRPRGDWPWAARDRTVCHLGLASVDCFTMPLSVCGASRVDMAAFTDPDFNFSAAGAALPFGHQAFMCQLARYLKKPTLWVIANLIRYHWRFEEGLRQEVLDRASTALGGRPEALTDLQDGTVRYHRGVNMSIAKLPLVEMNETTTLSAAVHVRSGQPDGGRRPLHVAQYIQVLDLMAEELAKEGKTISHVYFCSNVPEKSLVSVAHLRATVPRNYTYTMLPHVSFGNREAELVLRDVKHKKHGRLPPARAVFVEYVADVEILTKADIYIGTHSNMYAITSALRTLHFPHRPANHTCFLDSRKDPPPLVCEGTAAAHRYWAEMGAGWRLEGGTPLLH